MITEYKSKGFAFRISGLLLFFCTCLIGSPIHATPPAWITVALLTCVLASVVLVIVGLCYYAKAKGYSAVWGVVLPLLSCIGLLILAFLPDKADMDTPPPKIPFPVQAAKASLFAPLLSFIIGMLAQPQMRGNRIGMFIIGSISTLLIIAGFILGIMALVSCRRHGYVDTFGRAVTGTLINGLFVFGMLVIVPRVMMGHPHVNWSPGPSLHTFKKDELRFSYYSGWEVNEILENPGKSAHTIIIYGPDECFVTLALFPASYQETLENYAHRTAILIKGKIEQRMRGHPVDGTLESIVGNVSGSPRAGFQSHYKVHLANKLLSYSSYFFILRGPKHNIMVATLAADDSDTEVEPGIRQILNSIKIEGMAPTEQARPGMAGTNVSKSADPVSLSVKMIVYKPKDACALIGNKTVMAGDMLAGFKIIAVEKDSITVQSPAGAKKELHLGDVFEITGVSLIGWAPRCAASGRLGKPSPPAKGGTKGAAPGAAARQ
jgi:hypothetical protein